MIIDAQNRFSNAQAITAAAGSDNTIDLGAVRDIGNGEPLFVMVTVTTAFTDGSSNSTLTVALEGDSTTSFTPDGTQDLFIIPALAAAGSTYYYRLAPGMSPLNYQYIRLKYTPNNGDLSTGAVTAALVHGAQAYKAYADNITISG